MKRKFFYHYSKQRDNMTVHFKGKCFPADKIVCRVDAESKRNKRQPRIVMQGFAKTVTVKDGVATIK